MNISRSAARIGSLFGRMPGVLPAIGSLMALAAFTPAANAVVVVSPAANIVVPATTAGIYINVVSGASGGSSTTGWDINPWGSGSLFVYAATGGAIVSASPNSAVASLTTGTTIGAASTFLTTGGGGVATFGTLAGQWTLNSTNYFGFSFIGDDTALHYGYGTMIVGATALIRSVGQIYYESAASTAITIPAVPEPSSLAMMLAGGAVFGAVALRRRRQTAS